MGPPEAGCLHSPDENPMGKPSQSPDGASSPRGRAKALACEVRLRCDGRQVQPLRPCGAPPLTQGRLWIGAAPQLPSSWHSRCGRWLKMCHRHIFLTHRQRESQGSHRRGCAATGERLFALRRGLCGRAVHVETVRHARTHVRTRKQAAALCAVFSESEHFFGKILSFFAFLFAFFQVIVYH